MKPAFAILGLALSAPLLHSQDADVAKKLANPISDLISLPVIDQEGFAAAGARLGA